MARGWGSIRRLMRRFVGFVRIGRRWCWWIVGRVGVGGWGVCGRGAVVGGVVGVGWQWGGGFGGVVSGGQVVRVSGSVGSACLEMERLSVVRVQAGVAPSACAGVGAFGDVWLGVGGVVSDRADVWAFEGWVWRGRKVLRPYLWGVGVRVWLVGWCGGCWCYGTGCSGCGQAVGVMVCMWYGFCGWCDAKRGNFRTPSIALDFFDRCWVY